LYFLESRQRDALRVVQGKPAVEIRNNEVVESTEQVGGGSTGGTINRTSDSDDLDGRLLCVSRRADSATSVDVKTVTLAIEPPESCWREELSNMALELAMALLALVWNRAAIVVA
jgi:hypothetical protein